MSEGKKLEILGSRGRLTGEIVEETWVVLTQEENGEEQSIMIAIEDIETVRDALGSLFLEASERGFI